MKIFQFLDQARNKKMSINTKSIGIDSIKGGNAYAENRNILVSL